MLLLCLAPAVLAKQKTYTIEGELVPARWAYAAIDGVDRPYSAQTMIYRDGKFKFKNLAPGSYTLTIYVRRIGEFRQTYSVGPGTADEKGRVKLRVLVNPSRATRLYTPEDRFTVPIRKLSVPQKAWEEYFNARKKLGKRDVEGARKHLEKALELAPHFSEAWNNLGTIAYQSKDFARAEECFREAHEQDPEAFEPIVNLGGVLLSMNRPQEALAFNRQAVDKRPKDALAHSQMGLNYFLLEEFDRAEKHLQEAKRLDPGHFSYPQLILYRIHLKSGRRQAAATELEHFLRHHPDYPEARKLRELAAQLQKPEAPKP